MTFKKSKRGAAIFGSILLSIGFAVSASAADEKPSARKIPRPEGMSPGEYVFNLQYGGNVRFPDTGKGRALIVNLQKTVPCVELKKAIDVIHQDILVQVDLVSKAEAAEIVITVVDQVGKPSLSIFPDSSAAEVNVSPLSKDNPSATVLATRLRKEILRAYAYLGGIAGGAKGRLMDATTNLERLDAVEERLPGELSVRCDDYLARLGIEQWRETSYLSACEEGWAPKPTNVWQQAVWDRVHQKPTKGLKIKFDPKKGK